MKCNKKDITKVYFDTYFPDAGQRVYQENRSRCRFIKLEHCSTKFITEIKGIEVYFAHPYSSHERRTNENFNGLLREFLPKGQSFKDLTEKELKSYLSAINLRPRRLLDYQSSQKQFELLQTV